MRSSIQPLDVVQQTRFRHGVRYVEILAAILLWSVAASPAAAAPVLVQHVSKDAGVTVSSSLAFPANNIAGNWIGVVIRAGRSGQVLTVSDTRRNTYRQAVQLNQTLDAPNGETLAIYYAENIAGGANTITVTESLTNNTLRFAILEYSGVAASNSLDVTSAAQGSGTTLNSGTATTTVGGDLILGLVATANGQTFTGGSGYVIEERAPAAPNTKLIAEDAVQAAPGTVSAGATLSASDNGGALLAAFKAASGTLSPGITSLTPNNGPVGTSVTIAGSNFGASQGASTVTFNGVAALPANTTWSDTSITTLVPSGATTGNVAVTVGGQPSNGMSFTVTSTPPPTITSLTPNNGPVGTSVTIAGSNFGASQGASTVTFNGVAALPANTTWSDTSITTLVPNGAATGPVLVTAGGLVSNAVNFTVTPITIASLSQSSGPVGASVTITGTNFGPSQGSSTVLFNNVSATTTSWGQTSIIAVVPNGATTGNVVVTVGGIPSNGVNFAVTAPPPGINLVQHTSKDAGTVASSSLAFPANNTAGNWIGVVIRAGRSGQVLTVSDTNRNTYRAAVQFNQTLDAPNGDTFAIFYAENIFGGPNTVNVSESISGNTLRFAILEYSGVSSFNSLDVTAAAQGGNTSPNSGAATTTAGGDLLLGEVMTGSGTTASAGAGFKIEEAVPASPNIKLIVEDQILSSAGSASATATLGASVSWGAALAAFKPAGGGGAGPNISGVSPASGMVGAPVTITGINLGSSQGSSTVTFGGQPTGPSSAWSPTSITVNVPQGAVTGSIVVTVGGVPSNAINFTVNTLTVTVTPIHGGIEISQRQQFIGTALYDPQNLGVNWYVDSIFGGNTTVGTIDSSGLFSPGTQLGVHTVTAVSISNSSISATATIAVTDFPGTFTYHNDNSRTGQNLSEYALTPALVNTATFGKLFSCGVDGAVYAQPLWVPNLTIGGAKHNVLLVATAHDSLYAFDADTSPCVTLWQVNLIDSLHGGTSGEVTVPASGNLVGAGAGDISPEIGVVGTPVIDPASNTLYVVSKSVIISPLKFFQRLHAIDILTGSEKFGGPANISSAISVPGTGNGSSGGQLKFDERIENQRPGLALGNGIIYVSWGSHEDIGPWHGWVISFNASTLAFISAFCATPNGAAAGIWMSGGAPPIDSSNNLYVLTGNGDWDGVTNFGDSILKLDSGLSLASWFTPSDQSHLSINDLDLGSGGAAILIDLPSAPVPHLMIGGGKQGSNQVGELFLLNRDSLGGMTSTDTQPQIVQKFSVGGRIFSTSTFWNNNLYIAASGTRLKQYSFNSSTEQFTFAQQSNSVYGFPGATAAVSALGTTNGIAWALDNALYCTPQSPGCGPAVLHAYDATNISVELWNSAQDASGKDKAGNPVKFTVPTVANGKVYIGTRTEIDVYGLKPN